MAIAEAEPKKNEVAVTSTGLNDSVKTLNTVNNYSKDNEHASSSIQRTVKSYALYDNIKDFSFSMPGGWNDQDLGIFIESCWENLEDLKNPDNDENSRWREIARSGAKKSENPTLFTINSCMEVAQCLKTYVTRNEKRMGSNDTFKKFSDEVENLLPLFPPDPVESVHRSRSKSTEKKCDDEGEPCPEQIFPQESLEDTVADLIIPRASLIRDGNPTVWTELAEAVKERIGFCSDIKMFLEMMKRNVIADVMKEEDPHRRKEIFWNAKNYIIEVFDYVPPLTITKRDILSPVDSTVNMDEIITSTEKGDEFSSRKRRRSTSFSENEAGENKTDGQLVVDEPQVNEGIAEDNSFQAKKQRGRPRKIRTDETVSVKSLVTKSENESAHSTSTEPSSTTLLDEGSSTKIISENSHDRAEKNVEMERKRTKTPDSEQKTDYTNDIDEKMIEDAVIHPQDTRGRKRREDRWKRERPPPTRILPAREARTKVNLISKNRKSKASQSHTNNIAREEISQSPQAQTDGDLLKVSSLDEKNSSENVDESAKRSPNFRGFDDTECDITSEGENRKFRILQKVTTTRRTVTRTTLPNPDTTTNDLDDSEVNSVNSTEDDVPYVRRLTRQTKESVIKGKFVHEEKVENKITFVHADSTLNPVVKLQVLKDSDLREGLRRKMSSNTDYLSKINDKSLTFSVPRTKPNIPVESAVLGKDVVGAVYNPIADSAKIHAGPGSPPCSRSTGSRGVAACTASPVGKNNKANSVIRRPRQPYAYCSESDNDDDSEDLNKSSKSRGQCSSTVDRMMIKNKASHLSSRDNTPSQRAPPSKPSDISTVSQIQENSIRSLNYFSPPDQPSTSSTQINVRDIPPELAVAALRNYENEFFPRSCDMAAVPSFDPSYAMEAYHSKPKWYTEFVEELQKQSVWKMQQFVRMQQELIEVENQKLAVMKSIERSLNNRDS